jgi:hypothetical protein
MIQMGREVPMKQIYEEEGSLMSVQKLAVERGGCGRRNTSHPHHYTISQLIHGYII